MSPRSFCESSGGIWSEFLSGDENGTEEARNAVKKRVWERCGCKGTDCDGFGLEAEKSASGEILGTKCKYPEPSGDPLLQYLNQELPARSVPHRFFKASDGESVDNLSDLNLLVPSERAPEGDRFYYLDPLNGVAPQGNSFNMNAILGQFELVSFGSLPAKMFAVESGQGYVIRVVQGTYTPCLNCSSDSWQSSFSSYPPSKEGVGLQAAGYTHNRSEYQK